MSLIELIVGAGHARDQTVRGPLRQAQDRHPPLLRVPGQKFFGHVSTTFFSLKQFRDAMLALACHDFADTTVEFTQRAVAVCA